MLLQSHLRDVRELNGFFVTFVNPATWVVESVSEQGWEGKVISSDPNGQFGSVWPLAHPRCRFRIKETSLGRYEIALRSLEEGASWSGVAYQARVVDTVNGPCLVGVLGESYPNVDYWLCYLGLYLDPAAGDPVRSVTTREATLEIETDFAFRHFDARDGLAHSVVGRAVQDREGTMWISTRDGLARYDGQRFVTFRRDSFPGAETSDVRDIDLDPEGRLVVAVGSRIYWLEGSRFVPYHGNGTFGGESDKLDMLRVGPDGSVWFDFNLQELCRISPKGEFERVDFLTRELIPVEVLDPDSVAIPRLRVASLLPVSSGEIYLHTGERCVHFDFDEKRSRHMLTSQLHAVVDKGQGTELLGSNVWPVSYVPKTKKGTLFRLKDVKPSAAQPWLVGRNGVSRWGVVAGQLHRFSEERFTQYPLSDQEVHQVLCVDREGNVWVSLKQGGLGWVRPHSIHHRDEFDGLRWDQVLGLDVTSGSEYWMAANEGLVKETPNGFDYWEFTGSLSKNGTISAVIADSSEPAVSWVGISVAQKFYSEAMSGFRHGVAALSRLEGDHHDLHWIPENMIRYRHVHSMAWTKNRGLALGTSEGLFTFREDSFQHWNVNLPSEIIYAVLQDRYQDNLWLGTGDGLVRFDWSGTQRWNSGDNLSADKVLYLHQDSESRMWLGTAQGLDVWEDGRIHSFGAIAPILQQGIYQIQSDDEGHLWLGTAEGILCVKKQDLVDAIGLETTDSIAVTRFGLRDGLGMPSTRSTYFPSAGRRENGDLVFALEKGYARFDPRELLQRRQAPEVVLTGCHSLSDSFIENGLPEPDAEMPWIVAEAESRVSRRSRMAAGDGPLKLPPNAAQILRFDFSSVDIASPDQLRFRCRLQGHADEWIDLGTQRHASFPSLNPGDYVFEVKAVNDYQIGSSVPARIAFSISPYFYQTTAFKIGLLCLPLGMIWRWHHSRMLVKEMENQLRIDQERSRIARDVHDEIGSGLAQIRMLGELVDHVEPEKQDYGELSREIADLAKASSESLREIIWALNPDKSSFDDLTSYFHRFVEGFLRSSNVKPIVSFRGGAGTLQFSPQEKRDLLLILKEILTNTVKHADASEFVLHLALSSNAFSLTARDNGLGFDPDRDRKEGIGISNIEERSRRLGAECSVHSSPGHGVEYQLRLPIG